MINKINCSVKNCVYNNASTNECKAPSVAVNLNSVNSTETSKCTMCSTFVAK